MSGKRRRSETSWDIKQEKMPPKLSNSESNDPGRPSWKGNRNVPKDDDISRDRHDDEWVKPYSTRLPYRGRDRSRSPNRGSRDRESARARSRSPFYDDRHRSNPNDHVRNNSRLSSRPCKETWSHRSGGSRYSDTGISKIQCRFFAAGNCNRDDCKFSHDVSDSQQHHDRSSRPDKNRAWHDRHADLNPSDLPEKKKPWDGPSWDDMETGGGFDGLNDKKKSSWDDVSNPSLENKNVSWNGPLCDEVNVRDENKMKKWDDTGLNEKGCDDFLYQQHNVVNDSHLNNGNILSEEGNQQIHPSGKGQVENGKSPKKQEPVRNLEGSENNNSEQEQKDFNPAKLEEGNIGNYEKCRSPNRSTSRDWESDSRLYKGRHSRGDNLKESWNCRSDYSRYSHKRNSRNHYDDDDDGDEDGRRQSNRFSSIQCRFFSAGNCNRDDCKFSHDSQNHDRRSHDEIRAHKNTTWHYQQPHAADLNASDLSEKNKSWNGASWGDEGKKGTWGSHNSDDKKRSSQDDVSNPNLNDKNGSWNDRSWDDFDASGAKSVNEKTKSWVQMDDEKGYEKNDCLLPQQHNVVNDSTHLNNSNILSEEANQKILDSGKGQVPPLYTEQNLANAIDYLNSLSNSTHNQDTMPKEGNIGNENGKSPKKKQEQVGNLEETAKKAQESVSPEKVKTVSNGNENGKSPKKKHEKVGNLEENAKIEQESVNPEKVKEGNIGNENGKSPKKKHEQVGILEEKAKKEQESVNPEKVKEGNIGNDEKSMRQFRIALVEYVKEILKPKWKEGKLTREVYKTVVKKVVEKITSTIPEIQIPRTQAKIEIYLTHSKPKIMKLVEAYVEKLVKT